MRARRLVLALAGVVLGVFAFWAGSAVGAPTVEPASVLNATASSATLQATIVPEEGVETAYRFEYGTTIAYGSSAPVPDGTVGSTATATTVEAHIQGLSAATTYHYRVVAVAGGVETEGEDGTFTTQAIGGPLQLPDGRQWELVSPPNKHGAGVEALTAEGGDIQAAADGSAFTYVATGPVTADPGSNLSPEPSQVLSRRSAAGWSSEDIATPTDEPSEFALGEGPEYRLFSADLSLGLAEPQSQTPLSPEASKEGRLLYLREDASGAYLPLITASNAPKAKPFSTRFGRDLKFRGASSDLKHVVFSSVQALTPDVTTDTGESNLYEWTAGHLQLVSVLPDKEPANGSGQQVRLGDADGRFDRNAVSNDGSLVVWKTSPEKGTLYLRDTATRETVQLNQNIGEGKPVFQGASSDGSRVFFKEKESENDDLYVAEFTLKPHLAVTVTNITGQAVGKPGEVQGSVIGYSEDGTYVYFVANGRLTDEPKAIAGDCNGTGGSCSLYVSHFEAGRWSTRAIAPLSGADYADWAKDTNTLQYQTARVSPNGRFLAFMSASKLTGYDNRDVLSGALDQEVYMYDAMSNRIVCASCEPSGARPAGIYDPPEPPSLLVDRASNDGGLWLAGSLPGWTRASSNETNYQSRFVSNSGRLFFNSADGLVPQDINGLADVYEYESPAGPGSVASDSCTTASSTYSPRSEGCVSLISSGTSAEESAFLDASETGDDVFFATSARLVPGDYDKAFDAYDAHVCAEGALGGCSGVTAAPPACTTADSCRAAPAAQPAIFGAPPSATFSGAGNALPSSSPVAVGVKGKGLTRAQKLELALKACSRRPKRERAACRTTVRKRYARRSTAKSGRRGN